MFANPDCSVGFIHTHFYYGPFLFRAILYENVYFVTPL